MAQVWCWGPCGQFCPHGTSRSADNINDRHTALLTLFPTASFSCRYKQLHLTTVPSCEFFLVVFTLFNALVASRVEALNVSRVLKRCDERRAASPHTPVADLAEIENRAGASFGFNNWLLLSAKLFDFKYLFVGASQSFHQKIDFLCCEVNFSFVC